MNERCYRAFRAYQTDLIKYYELSIEDIEPLSSKAFKIYDSSGNAYFLKEVGLESFEKYQFLSNEGVNNILYPALNRDKNFVTRYNNHSIYLNTFIESVNLKDELMANSLYHELNNLHQKTSFKRQLSPNSSRPKFEEITRRLDYLFRSIEEYIRGVESRPLTRENMQILGNYQYVLDAKKELVRLQKRIISSIKARESINYSYVHNKPRLDHIISVKGIKYLTSIENGRIGISSLDMAKLYIENEDLNIDFKSIIDDFYRHQDNPFYYDYFRYLVLLFTVKRLNVTNDLFVDANLFITTSNSIKKYFDSFPDYKEEYNQDE